MEDMLYPLHIYQNLGIGDLIIQGEKQGGVIIPDSVPIMQFHQTENPYSVFE